MSKRGNTLPLTHHDGHLFLNIDGKLWLLDTGAPGSLGTDGTVMLAGMEFRVQKNFLGFTAGSLSELLHVEVSGLLGGDVLNRFDLVIDAPSGKVEISTARLEHRGAAIPLELFMGIPIVTALIGGIKHRMFFDTGAQIGYLQDDDVRTSFPSAGRLTDFFPGAGRFQTETHQVDISLGEENFVLRSGVLPDLLGAMLVASGTDGIVGNQILLTRAVGYFPRRKELVL